MKREIYKKLLDWKNSRDRKPLILKGARQTGKTYCLIFLSFSLNFFLDVFLLTILVWGFPPSLPAGLCISPISPVLRASLVSLQSH
jgi:hypothetical protein